MLNQDESSENRALVSHSSNTIDTGFRVDDWIENLVTWCEKHFGQDSIIAAKDLFFTTYGKIFPDDPGYEARMVYFNDFFLFEHLLSEPRNSSSLGCNKLSRSAFIHYIGSRQSAAGGLRDFRVRSFLHSIFLVESVKKHILVVKDLVNAQGITLSVRPDESFETIQSKQIFQGFLYFDETHAYLSRGVLFHPMAVSKTILKKLKNTDFRNYNAKLESLSKLARCHLRMQRQKTSDPSGPYADFS